MHNKFKISKNYGRNSGRLKAKHGDMLTHLFMTDISVKKILEVAKQELLLYSF